MSPKEFIETNAKQISEQAIVNGTIVKGDKQKYEELILQFCHTILDDTKTNYAKSTTSNNISIACVHEAMKIILGVFNGKSLPSINKLQNEITKIT